jgi:hypothetical protein
MLNNAEKAIQYLKESQELVENKSDILMSVETLVNSQVLSEKLNLGMIQQMNTAATLLCSGNTFGAKEQLEDLLEKLDLKVLASSTDSKGILPSYLVNILVYLLLKTSKCGIILTICREL